MALLGQGARGAPVDYSSWADSAWRLAESNVGAFNKAADAVTGILEDRKVKKDQIKVSDQLLKAYETLNPDSAEAFKGISEALKDEERPLSERAAFAEQIGTFIGMDQERQKQDRQIAEFAQKYALEAQRVGIDQGRFNNENSVFQANFADGQEERAASKEVEVAIGNATLSNAISIAKQMEAAGQQPPMSSAQLQQTLQTGVPIARIRTAEAFNSLLPRAKEPKIHTIDATDSSGNPISLPVTFNYDTGKFDPVKIGNTASAVSGLPAGLANYAGDFEAAGAKYGVDPKLLAAISMHETGNGTSAAFRNKNNAMGVSDSKGPTMQASVPASIERMAKLLGSTTSGPYKNADTIPEIAKIYAPPGAGNDPRGLNKHWVDGVSKYYAELGGDPSAMVKITPGAVKSTAAPKTPTEQAIDEARLQNLQAQAQNRTADFAKQEDAKATARASAENSLQLIDDLRKHPGFSSAVGMSLTPGFIPATDRKGAEAIVNQLKGASFLTAIQQLRGLGALSDAEGKKLEQAAARLDTNQSEKDFLNSLSDFEKQIREAMGRLGGASAPAAPQSASDRLRSRINGQ